MLGYTLEYAFFIFYILSSVKILILVYFLGKKDVKRVIFSIIDVTVLI